MSKSKEPPLFVWSGLSGVTCTFILARIHDYLSAGLPYRCFVLTHASASLVSEWTRTIIKVDDEDETKKLF